MPCDYGNFAVDIVGLTTAPGLIAEPASIPYCSRAGPARSGRRWRPEGVQRRRTTISAALAVILVFLSEWEGGATNCRIVTGARTRHSPDSAGFVEKIAHSSALSNGKYPSPRAKATDAGGRQQQNGKARRLAYTEAYLPPRRLEA
jgi:hypothetical protein